MLYLTYVMGPLLMQWLMVGWQYENFVFKVAMMIALTQDALLIALSKCILNYLLNALRKKFILEKNELWSVMFLPMKNNFFYNLLCPAVFLDSIYLFLSYFSDFLMSCYEVKYYIYAWFSPPLWILGFRYFLVCWLVVLK